MHFTSILTILSTLGAVSASPRYGARGHHFRRAQSSNDSTNPFEGKKLYANPDWAEKLEQTYDAFVAKGDSENAGKVRTIQNIGTFVWISNTASLPNIDTAIERARTAQEKTGEKQIVGLVLYNLPDRDCSAGESAGEFSSEENGLELYKETYIKPYAEKLAAASDLTFAVVLEPDSLANLVTNLNVEFCAKAQPVYEEGIAHAIASLQLDHVNLYIDAAHGGWLGWSDNLLPSAKIFAKVVQKAGNNTKIRGFSTNVSNYNPFHANPRANYTEWSTSWDENHYALSLAPYLEAEGLPSRFIIDQGRVSNSREEWGEWCNVNPAGFGTQPGTPVNNTHIDSIVWVKPGGESDGRCGLEGAPVAGAWFDEYVQMLVENADPSIVASEG
ncbi:glycoside hydrolase family 6 protein [Colletotrichum tofieldiae]|uniref:Glucanase n=1 Tax=Colletotrichum tofieldiae TaxID=708197 RepID=A0A166SLJ1_9PEZI|nr:glycoside hydrolase family 6 protein [Colletotrichum tofieldiae]GKT66914.1 glycoside hydrolase family 6 protein [Colletotrichum tofieldiae]GKT80473.1 glycoside hydrolase family 6 protein [Colletotrichum tofieldiae]GKT94836.1 glycoside hydrolase family 6 protein [Colletotrichum tofieldiae]